MAKNVDQIKALLDKCSEEQRREIFQYLRIHFSIHPIEDKLNCSAEIILEAIARASDLTLRGIRGIIAEASFKYEVLDKLKGWKDVTSDGNEAFDFKIKDSKGSVTIQVKMQRQKEHKPMMANKALKILPEGRYVVETQRTRGGKDLRTGENTRPYRFGEFDIIAVSMHPSTNSWNSFRYTVADWLLPMPTNKKLLLKFQPVSIEPDEDWTDDLLTCIKWLRSGNRKTIGGKKK
jgi:hypothetical protein